MEGEIKVEENVYLKFFEKKIANTKSCYDLILRFYYFIVKLVENFDFIFGQSL